MATDDPWALNLVDAQRHSAVNALVRDWDQLVLHIAALVGDRPAGWGAADGAVVHARELAFLSTARRIDDQLWQQLG